MFEAAWSRFISIHPPRGGRDVDAEGHHLPPVHISIHPPRGGRDDESGLFRLAGPNFNPPSPWGEGRPSGRSRCSR